MKKLEKPDRFSKVYLSYQSKRHSASMKQKLFDYVLKDYLILMDTCHSVKTAYMLLFCAPLYDITSFSFTYRISAFLQCHVL